jgi:hypothetical protein
MKEFFESLQALVDESMQTLSHDPKKRLKIFMLIILASLVVFGIAAYAVYINYVNVPPWVLWEIR